MEQRETQRQVLDRLVAEARLSREEADLIRTSPEWSLTVRELVAYLAGIIILSGFVRIIAMALQDASENTVATVLLVAGGSLAALAWKLPRGTDWWQRLAEIVETGSLACLAGSAGLWLSLTDLSGQTIVLLISVPAIAWGWWRSQSARFVGSLCLSAGVPMMTMSVSAMFHEDSGFTMGAGALVAGAALWSMGQRDVRTAFIQRAVGCYFGLMGSFMLMGEGGIAGNLVPIVAGAVLFGLGSISLQPESLAAGAIAITVGVTVAMGEWLPSEFTRGLTTIAVGVVMLLATMGQLRKRNQPHGGGAALSRRGPGTPSA